MSGAYVGWNIGANDAGNWIGTSVGARVITYKRAIILVSVFATLGGLLQGREVMMTMSTGIVTSGLPNLGVFVALLSGGLFVTTATLLKLPVSTSEAIIGGVLGVGVALGGDISFSMLAKIGKVWVICPVLVGFMAAGIYAISTYVLKRIKQDSIWQRLPNVLLLISACYISFSLGANHVGTAMGPLVNAGISTTVLSILGGLALAAGALTFGHRVTGTIGGGITLLDPISAFSAQISAALAIHFFSIIGIPVSTTQSVVGAVIGVGLVKGVRMVKKKQVIEIVTGWVATPTLAGVFAFLVYKVISLVL